MNEILLFSDFAKSTKILESWYMNNLKKTWMLESTCASVDVAVKIYGIEECCDFLTINGQRATGDSLRVSTFRNRKDGVEPGFGPRPCTSRYVEERKTSFGSTN